MDGCFGDVYKSLEFGRYTPLLIEISSFANYAILIFNLLYMNLFPYRMTSCGIYPRQVRHHNCPTKVIWIHRSSIIMRTIQIILIQCFDEQVSSSHLTWKELHKQIRNYEQIQQILRKHNYRTWKKIVNNRNKISKNQLLHIHKAKKTLPHSIYL